MSDVRKPSYTELRGNLWQYRRRVPSSLVPVVDYSEYRETLHTSKIEEARTTAAIRNAEVTAELEAAKRRLKVGTVSGSSQRLSAEALRYIRDAVHTHTLKVVDEFSRSRPDFDSLFALQFMIEESVDKARRASAVGPCRASPARPHGSGKVWTPSASCSL